MTRNSLSSRGRHARPAGVEHANALSEHASRRPDVFGGIPTRKDQPRQPDFDKAAYRERNKVDRLIGRLKQYRRIATRYEKRVTNYLAMITLGMAMLWLT